MLCEQARAEALCLAAEVDHHVGAEDPVRVSGEVLHLGGLLEQAAPGVALDHQRP
jgi:hypothetical protein